MNFIKLYTTPLLLAILAIVLYSIFGYDLERSNFIKLISLYSALFIIAYFLIEKQKLSFRYLAGLGIIFRLIFIVLIPNLSQDFYRFIWDGRLLAQGVSPYLFTPEAYLNSATIASQVVVAQAQQLYEGMGALNASHYSNYPPINQLFFAIAALFSSKSILGSVIVFRLLLILADIGILYFGKKILERLNLPIKNIFWYFLSPFIIIELSGNLHFEGIMLFFFVWALYLLFKGKWAWAAVLIGASISVKLIPLLLLPLFLNYFASTPIFKNKTDWFVLLKFYSLVILSVLLSFLPFLSSEFIAHFSSTIALWFQNFEFNASVYYLIRWVGFQVVGWNIIETVGKVLPVIVLLFILGLSFFRKNKTPQQLITALLFGISFYFLLATTVHPWYVATPLLLSVFTKYKFSIVWSFVVALSYAAYGQNGFDENLWLVALEYSLLIAFALWEIFSIKKVKENSF